MLRAVLLFVIAYHSTLASADVVVATQHFELRSDARSNLHQFLLAWSAADRQAWPPYALTIAERESWRVLLDDKDARGWSAAIEAYTATVNRDVLNDEGLIALRGWAAGSLRPESVPSSDRPLIGALDAALPIYEKYWWRSHDAENRAWIQSAGGELRIIENEMVRRLTAAYAPETTLGAVPRVGFRRFSGASDRARSNRGRTVEVSWNLRGDAR